MANLIVDAVEQTKVGVATGINAISRVIGGALGSQVLASVILAHAALNGLATDQGFTIGFAVAAGAVGLAFLVALAIPVRGERDASAMPMAAARL